MKDFSEGFVQEARSLVRLGGLACLAWGGDAMQLKPGRLSPRVWPQENWLRRYLRFLWGDPLNLQLDFQHRPSKNLNLSTQNLV